MFFIQNPEAGQLVPASHPHLLLLRLSHFGLRGVPVGGLQQEDHSLRWWSVLLHSPNLHHLIHSSTCTVVGGGDGGGDGGGVLDDGDPRARCEKLALKHI